MDNAARRRPPATIILSALFLGAALAAFLFRWWLAGIGLLLLHWAIGLVSILRRRA